MNMDDLQKEMNKTKAALMSKRELTFYTTIIFSLEFVWDACGTSWVDGYKMGWDPTWFMRLDREERVGVMAHEAGHIAKDHVGVDGRRGNRDPRIWNYAADHVINLELDALGIKLPKPNLCDARFKGMSTEQVYAVLIREQPPEMPGVPMDLKEPPQDKTPEQHRRHIEDILIRAATQARIAGGPPGCIPGDVEVFLQKLLKPKLPWHVILRRAVKSLASGGSTWLVPNRRYFPTHYLPGRWSKQPAELTVYMDISGSVTDEQFNVFVSEVVGAMRTFAFKKLRIVQFNTMVTKDDTVKSLRQLSQVKFKGRGGTDPECIFRHMEETKPELAIVFTDGEFHWRRESLNQDLIWIINDNPHFTAKFGQVVHFET